MGGYLSRRDEERARHSRRPKGGSGGKVREHGLSSLPLFLYPSLSGTSPDLIRSARVGD